MKYPKLVTTPKYWDCECEYNYIHLKSVKECPICHTHPDEQPDSRVNEVRKMKLALVSEKIHDFEYLANGLQHLNNAGISVRNLKRIKGGYKADIIIFIEDTQERTNGCVYFDWKFKWEEVK